MVFRFRFKLPVTLKHHIASVHERAYLAVCEICAKTFKTKQGFREHLLTHNDTDETRVECAYCKAMLKNRVSLKTHIRRTHKSSPKKCPHCEKIKPNQQSLASHILVVHSKPSHQCTICDRSFTKALSLTVSQLCIYLNMAFDKLTIFHIHFRNTLLHIAARICIHVDIVRRCLNQIQICTNIRNCRIQNSGASIANEKP